MSTDQPTPGQSRANRRDVLKSAAFIGMSAWAVGRGAWADDTNADANKTPNEKVNIACIGVGGKGDSDSNHAGQVGNVVAIVDIDEGRLEKKAKQYPKAEKFTEWELPLPWAAPYEVTIDKNAEAWTGSMLTDQVTRINTKTGEAVNYLLPRSTNIRRVHVDNSTTPVTFWVGSNHGASVVKVEPLD